MSDQTGEYTGEMIFDGRSVTRVLGTSYNAQGSPEEGRLTPPRLSALSRTWALEEPAAPQTPTSLLGLNQGSIYALLRATRDLLVEDGFEKLTLERCMARSRLEPEVLRVVRHHFGSADDLAVLLMRQVHAPLFADLSEAAISNGSVLETLHGVLRRYIGRIRRDLPLYQRYTRVFNNILDPERIAPRTILVLQEIERQAIQITAALLAEGQMRGEVRSGDPETLARGLEMCINGLICGVSNTSRLMVVGVHADDLIDRSLGFLVDGLSAAAADRG